MGSKINIKISKDLYEKIKKRVEESEEFSTVSEYVEYVLEEVLKSLEEKEFQEENAFSKEDEEKIKERLKALGYLD